MFFFLRISVTAPPMYPAPPTTSTRMRFDIGTEYQNRGVFQRGIWGMIRLHDQSVQECVRNCTFDFSARWYMFGIRCLYRRYVCMASRADKESSSILAS